MLNKHLTTYLNDHLAGSVTALKILERLEAHCDGTDVSRFAADLRSEVLADQRELEMLMRRLQIAQSRTRKATAWVAQKFTTLKLKMDDPGGSGLREFEALEFLEIGIEGKRGLWRALAAASERVPELQGVDYGRLAQRAQVQHDQLETVRLETAKMALASRT